MGSGDVLSLKISFIKTLKKRILNKIIRLRNYEMENYYD